MTNHLKIALKRSLVPFDANFTPHISPFIFFFLKRCQFFFPFLLLLYFLFLPWCPPSLFWKCSFNLSLKYISLFSISLKIYWSFQQQQCRWIYVQQRHFLGDKKKRNIFLKKIARTIQFKEKRRFRSDKNFFSFFEEVFFFCAILTKSIIAIAVAVHIEDRKKIYAIVNDAIHRNYC